jgi:hypothetical protein
MANFSFDSTGIEPAKPFEVLPAGRYSVVVTDSDLVRTQAGDGQMVKLELTIVDGPHANRKLFDRITVDNPNAEAVRIGREQLSAVCHAVGLPRITDTQQLHGKPLVAVVKVEPAGKGRDGKDYDATNRVKGYLPLSEAASLPAGGNVKPSFGAPAANAAPAKPAQPWAQKRA